jgi:hypothetical protein
MRRHRLTLVAPALVMLLAACGSNAGPRRVTIPRHLAPLTRTTTGLTTAARPAPAGPPIGTSQHTDVGGAQLTVTITQVLDPLTDSGAALPPGNRAVGVEVAIANAGPSVYDSSATGDFSVIASGGQVEPEYAPSGVCQTPLRDFDNYITAGENRSGCVVFAVPLRAKLLAVRFSPHAQAAGRLTWRVS